MLDSKTLAKAGTLLLIDHGAYSDYYVVGIFKVEKDFIPYNLLESYLVENPKNREDYYFESDRFVNYLLSNGYIKETSYDNLYTGSYGSIDDIEYRG